MTVPPNTRAGRLSTLPRPYGLPGRSERAWPVAVGEISRLPGTDGWEHRAPFGAGCFGATALLSDIGTVGRITALSLLAASI